MPRANNNKNMKRPTSDSEEGCSSRENELVEEDSLTEFLRKAAAQEQEVVPAPVKKEKYTVQPAYDPVTRLWNFAAGKGYVPAPDPFLN